MTHWSPHTQLSCQVSLLAQTEYISAQPGPASLNKPGFKAQMGKPRLRKLEDQILRGATFWMFGLGESYDH